MFSQRTAIPLLMTLAIGQSEGKGPSLPGSDRSLYQLEQSRQAQATLRDRSDNAALEQELASAASQSLANRDPGRVLREVIENITPGATFALRQAAIQRLASMTGSEAVQARLDLLDKAEVTSSQRAELVSNISRANSPEAIALLARELPRLIEHALTDYRASVGTSALSKVPASSPESEPPVDPCVEEKLQFAVNVTWELAQLSDARNIELLRSIAEDQQIPVDARQAAVTGLARRGDDTVPGLCAQLLKEEPADGELRVVAANVLGDLPSQASLHLLVETLLSESRAQEINYCMVGELLRSIHRVAESRTSAQLPGEAQVAIGKLINAALQSPVADGAEQRDDTITHGLLVLAQQLTQDRDPRSIPSARSVSDPDLDLFSTLAMQVILSPHAKPGARATALNTIANLQPEAMEALAPSLLDAQHPVELRELATRILGQSLVPPPRSAIEELLAMLKEKHATQDPNGLSLPLTAANALLELSRMQLSRNDRTDRRLRTHILNAVRTFACSSCEGYDRQELLNRHHQVYDQIFRGVQQLLVGGTPDLDSAVQSLIDTGFDEGGALNLHIRHMSRAFSPLGIKGILSLLASEHPEVRLYTARLLTSDPDLSDRVLGTARLHSAGSYPDLGAHSPLLDHDKRYLASLSKAGKYGISQPFRYPAAVLNAAIDVWENPARYSEHQKSAVIICADDWNQAFVGIGESLLTLQQRGQAIVLVEAETDKQAVAQLRSWQTKAGLGRGWANSLIIAAHGSPAALALGNPFMLPNDSPPHSANLDINDRELMRELGSHLAPGGSIALIGCNVAPADKEHNITSEVRQRIPHAERVIGFRVADSHPVPALEFSSDGKLLALHGSALTRTYR